MLSRFVLACERLIFGHRAAVLALLALVTAAAALFATRLHMTAGFGKQLPLGHEYTETFVKYKDVLFGANRLIVVVHARQGDIWKPETLKKLNEVTQALMYLPGVDRRSVSSLWTPNTRVMQVTEEGYEARDVIGGDITPEKLDAAAVARIRDNVVQGGYVGSLVASDFSGAMVTADLLDADPRTKEPTDYIALGPQIEKALRTAFEDEGHEIRIIGFAKQISDIAQGAQGVVVFFALAFALTALAVWWYCRSWAFTAAALTCSLVSLVWQFASLQLLGYGLDPLAILVPFLVFAIGVSHGVQQINTIVREIGALVAVLGGLDMLVFTAGIGEHNAAIRERVCAGLAYLGLALDGEANAQNADRISSAVSRIPVQVERTNEEWVAAWHACRLLPGLA